MKTPAHLSCGVAALALLLTACGGGSGNDNNDKAVSASPVAPVNPVVPANSGSASAPLVTTSHEVITTPSSTPPASPIVATPDSALPANPVAAAPDNTLPTESVNDRAIGNIATLPSNPASIPPAQAADVALTTSQVSPIAEAPLPQPAAVTPQPLPLISGQGVRGDVLLTMMDQQPCDHYLNETTSHDGLTVPKETIPRLSIYSRLTPTNYPAAPVMPAPGYPPPGYRDVTCSSGYYPYQPAAAGSTYEYESITKVIYNRSCNSDYCPRGLHQFALWIPFVVGQDSLRLGWVMKTHMHEDRGNGIHDESEFWSIDNQLMADSDFSFSLNDTVPFGVKNIWKDNENHVQLMVLDAAPAKDSAKLCWNIVSPRVKRLQCTTWKIPTGWQRGKLLEDTDSYIIDDRSSYPGESGLAYFRANPPQ